MRLRGSAWVLIPEKVATNMTARSYDYDTKAMTYDALELDTEGVTKVNLFLKRIFQKNKAKKRDKHN